jgi:hypothetical protein
MEIRCLRRAVEQYPDESDLAILLGSAETHAGRPLHARSVYEQALVRLQARDKSAPVTYLHSVPEFNEAELSRLLKDCPEDATDTEIEGADDPWREEWLESGE